VALVAQPSTFVVEGCSKHSRWINREFPRSGPCGPQR
jgi:hypothetical protein